MAGATYVAGVRPALFLPIFGELADPRKVALVAAAGEEAGWDGVFVWDHMNYRPPVTDIGDPWIALAAVAAATESVLLGPMVTPLARRRPHKVARETASLDLLSAGRLVLGVGLGGRGTADPMGDPGNEIAATGEETSPKVRAAMLDEALDVITALWSGEVVHHHGEHYLIDGLRFLPTPVQRPRPPIWVAGRPGFPAPVRRARRYDGFFPVDVQDPEQLVAMGPFPDGFDLVVDGPAGTDPAPWAAAGATWWLSGFSPSKVTFDAALGVAKEGPPC
jgi:alkanesulfonate monooxygenase SsuD/methylene tetrahydromethanopterin reductase-like flavin-dependent oxidoreductase (luciferase family)